MAGNNKKIRLLITVDTEEEFIWDEGFKRSNVYNENIKRLCLIDEIFRTYRVKPTYLVDYAVTQDKDSTSILRNYYEGGTCEIGAHLHTWITPPFEEEVNVINSYASNLPYELIKKKVSSLHESIYDAFHINAVSFKSGRYGFDEKVAGAIDELNYKVDTSITPYMSHEAEGGPDFNRAHNNAYFFSHDNIHKENRGGGILEVPMSIGFTRADMRFWGRIFNFLEQPFIRNIPLKGVLSKLGIVEKVNISPEGEDSGSIIAMMKVFIENNHEFINLNFHSSSLLEGYTPYVKNKDDLDKFLKAITATLEYLFNNANVEPLTLSEFYDYKKRQIIE